MNYMPSSSKNTKKFNVIDAIIIIIVIACIAGVFFRLFINKSNASSEQYTVIFTASGLTRDEIGMVYVDTEIYVTENGLRKVIGVVADNNIESVSDIFRIERDSLLVKDENGNYTEAYYPEDTKYTIEGKLSVSGSYVIDEGFSTASGVKLSPGMMIVVHTETADLEITVIEIAKN